MKQKNIHDRTYRVATRADFEKEFNGYCDLMWKYSSYGALDHCSYNHHLQRAITVIGQLHAGQKNCDSKQSHYHNGLKFIAKEAGVSRHEIKALSKTGHKYQEHQSIHPYKSSYHLDMILGVMVKDLKSHAKDPKVVDFLKLTGTNNYRDAILGTQYQTLLSNKALVENIDNFKQKDFTSSNEKIAKLG